MKDALKEELKAETERFKTFAFLLVASVSGTTALFLNDDLGINLKIQVLFILGFFTFILFLFQTIKSYLNMDILILQLKNPDYDNV